MSRLPFFSRVAFICNVCFLMVWLMRYLPAMPLEFVTSTILIAGLVLSFVMNGLVNILYATLLVRRRPIADYVPVWLATINFIFLFLQLYLVLK